MLALGSLHSQNIIHRMLTPENVLMDANGYVQLNYFRHAKRLNTADDFTNSFVGSPEYMAPEVVERNGHDQRVDWWSLGCLMFEMATGVPPFEGTNNTELKKSILGKKVQYPAGHNFSSPFKNVIKSVSVLLLAMNFSCACAKQA